MICVDLLCPAQSGPLPARPNLVACLGQPRLLVALVFILGWASTAPVRAQESQSDLPVFDLIFLDDSAPPPAVQRMAPAPSPQANQIAAIPATPPLADPPLPPATRLSSLRAPQSQGALDRPLPRIIGTDVTPPPEPRTPSQAAPTDTAAIVLPVPVPAPVPVAVPQPEPDLSPAELARALQQELARVGCYRGGIDGDWGRGSRRALEQYLTRTSQTAEGQDPSPVLLEMVRASPAAVCPPPPPPVAQPVRASPPAPAARSQPPVRATPAPATQPRATPPAQASPPPASRLERGLSGGFR